MNSHSVLFCYNMVVFFSNLMKKIILFCSVICDDIINMNVYNLNYYSTSSEFIYFFFKGPDTHS